jgi:hypothetical protein
MSMIGSKETIGFEEFFALVRSGQARCGLCAMHYETDGSVCDEGILTDSPHRKHNGFGRVDVADEMVGYCPGDLGPIEAEVALADDPNPQVQALLMFIRTLRAQIERDAVARWEQQRQEEERCPR